MNEFLHRIKTHFPELSWIKHEHISDGWDHDVIILDDSLVFRFPNSPEYLAVLVHEVEVLRFLSDRCRVSLPQYAYLANDGSFGGYPLVAGVPLMTDVFENLPPSHLSSLEAQLADFLTALHRVDRVDAQSLHVSERKPLEYDLKRLATEVLRPNLAAPDYLLVKRIVSEVESIEAMKVPGVLVHGDLSPKHLLWDETTMRLGVIDFSDRNLDDPAFDFAELYLYGTDFVKRVYELYDGPKDSGFLDRAKVYLRRVGVFLLADSYRNSRVSHEHARSVYEVAMAL